jgi:hypothetical protein
MPAQSSPVPQPIDAQLLHRITTAQRAYDAVLARSQNVDAALAAYNESLRLTAPEGAAPHTCRYCAGRRPCALCRNRQVSDDRNRYCDECIAQMTAPADAARDLTRSHLPNQI